jgi:hypothetical protein
MPSISFKYLYRDASNFKKFGVVVFSNDEGVDAIAVANSLVSHFWPEGLFIASQVNVPELFVFDDYPLNPDDHCFHEFASVECSDGAVTDRFGRSIAEFMRDVEVAAEAGWEVFDPLEPFAQEIRASYKKMFHG